MGCSILQLHLQAVIDEQQCVDGGMSQPPIDRTGVQSRGCRTHRRADQCSPHPAPPSGCSCPRPTDHRDRRPMTVSVACHRDHRHIIRPGASPPTRSPGFPTPQTECGCFVSARLLGDQEPPPHNHDQKKGDNESSHTVLQYTDGYGLIGVLPVFDRLGHELESVRSGPTPSAEVTIDGMIRSALPLSRPAPRLFQ